MSQACSYPGPLHMLPRHQEPSSHTHISPAVLILQSFIHKSHPLQTRQMRPPPISPHSFLSQYLSRLPFIFPGSICLTSFFPGTTLSTTRTGTSLFCHPLNLQALAQCQTHSKSLINMCQMTKWVIPYTFLLSLLPSLGDLKVGSPHQASNISWELVRHTNSQGPDSRYEIQGVTVQCFHWVILMHV